MVSRYKFTIFILAVVLLLIAGSFARDKAAVPEAQGRPLLTSDQVKLLFVLMDTDRDGKISRQEWMSFMQAEFDRLDTKKTGELTPNDMSQLRLQVNTFSGNGK